MQPEKEEPPQAPAESTALPTAVTPALAATPPAPAEPLVATAVVRGVRADDPGAVPTTAREVEVVEYNRDKDIGYSYRRMLFVFSMCAFFATSATAFVAFSYTGDLVTKYVEGAFSLMGSIVLYYLAAGVLDRQEVLRRLGDSFRGRDGRSMRTEEESPPR
jgi:hypothetical protein